SGDVDGHHVGLDADEVVEQAQREADRGVEALPVEQVAVGRAARDEAGVEERGEAEAADEGPVADVPVEVVAEDRAPLEMAEDDGATEELVEAVAGEAGIAPGGDELRPGLDVAGDDGGGERKDEVVVLARRERGGEG